LVINFGQKIKIRPQKATTKTKNLKKYQLKRCILQQLSPKTKNPEKTAIFYNS